MSIIERHAFIFVLTVTILVISILCLQTYAGTNAIDMNQETIDAFRSEGIDISRISVVNNEWYYDGKPTHVCALNAGDRYRPALCYAGRLPRVPVVSTQAKFVSEAIKTGGVHPKSPRVYE